MLLAVDTSTQWMGVSLYNGDEVLGELSWKTKNHHTTELAPSIDVILERCGVEVKTLDCLAVALGPGSFTSLRIGLAHVKGMALALHIPVIGVPTLDILAAAQSPDSRELCAILHAGRSRLAYQFYHWQKTKWISDTEPQLGHAADLAKLLQEEKIVCGELTGEDRRILKEFAPLAEIRTPAKSLRRTAFLAEIAWQRYRKGDVDDAATLAPIYLHVGDPIPG